MSRAEELMTDMSTAADELIAESAPLPLPPDLLPVEPLPLAALPDALRPWVADVSERMQCPADFVGVPMLVGAAALVARRVGIPESRERVQCSEGRADIAGQCGSQDGAGLILNRRVGALGGHVGKGVILGAHAWRSFCSVLRWCT